MTREQRDWLRNQIDRARRNIIDHHRARNPRHYCAGCGCLNDDFTIGCRACMDRRRRRNKRQNESVPCANHCGNTIAPAYTAKPGNRWTGLCVDCYTLKRKIERKAA